MNLKTVKALADIMEKSGLTALEVEEGEVKIRLEKTCPPPAVQIPAYGSAPQQTAAPAIPAKEPAVPVLDFNNITEVKSPMVGVFYASASPDAEPYIKKGSLVKKGDVLCIIEAMKLMNEITAETDGEVADICVQNGEVVEFSQVLFKLF